MGGNLTVTGTSTLNDDLTVDSDGGGAVGSVFSVTDTTASLQVYNVGGTSTHGITITQDYTQISGGNTTTTLTLDNNEALISGTGGLHVENDTDLDGNLNVDGTLTVDFAHHD